MLQISIKPICETIAKLLLQLAIFRGFYWQLLIAFTEAKHYRPSSHFLPDLVLVHINMPPTTSIPTVNINPKASILQVFNPLLP